MATRSSVHNDLLHFVTCFKYLGHMIMSNNFDDADIQREITNMFVSTKLQTR